MCGPEPEPTPTLSPVTTAGALWRDDAPQAVGEERPRPRCAAGRRRALFEPACWQPRPAGLRRFCLVSSAVYLRQRRRRRRGGPPAPAQAVAADRLRRSWPGGRRAGRAAVLAVASLAIAAAADLALAGARGVVRGDPAGSTPTGSSTSRSSTSPSSRPASCCGRSPAVVAADLPLSQWFLLVAAFGSLFMVAGKRYSELLTLGGEAGTRRVPGPLLETYLRFVWSLAAGVDVIGLQPVGVRDAPRAPACRGPRSRSPRSCSACCGTPWTSTPAPPASRRTSCWRDRVLQVLGVVWLVARLPRGARCLSDRRPRHVPDRLGPHRAQHRRGTSRRTPSRTLPGAARPRRQPRRDRPRARPHLRRRRAERRRRRARS